jgi:protocatechuate 3,4-dioxygenase alpha subunit
MLWDERLRVVHRDALAGERIAIRGRVLDANGEPLRDAVVETWQADPDGRYRHPTDRWPLDEGSDPFTGFGRSGIDRKGFFELATVRPGRVPYDAERHQAPHLVLCVLGRGLLDHLVTRCYFGDDPATTDDPILALLPAERRATLVATREDDGPPVLFTFDICLQGESETVFLEP